MSERGVVFEPSAVAAGMGIVSTPIGTLKEIQEQGLDTGEVSCCAPSNPGAGVRGCPMWKACRFNRIRFAGRTYPGFKGEGPEYVGYFLRTTKSDRAHAVEQVAACYNFVRVLQHRSDHGTAQRQQGKDGEKIQIVGFSPSRCAKMGIDAKANSVVMVRRWEPNAADGGNKSGDITMKTWTEPMGVPEFPRPGQNPGITYDQQLRLREEARDVAEDGGGDLDSIARMREIAESVPEVPEPDEPLELGSSAPSIAEQPLAAPVGKGKR